ncbi:hypothetical protein SNOG_16351 [Parastagonospora nodorum SN15]|uniref:Uncharacterized protein n=1 Tax=Phaeosphaeria nodorum (strain SN15 / ATCC MYA-4574 / FGSC 10173) TaxID=321614 RepID=Q0TW38_PHANO|nr:hypothetical protein SNOG_16351 [Parastagonospora nodorum SN15]EAT76337.1 hypothetical protein SNOG_16351 [Parastagonospora nodorum SN15]
MSGEVGDGVTVVEKVRVHHYSVHAPAVRAFEDSYAGRTSIKKCLRFLTPSRARLRSPSGAELVRSSSLEPAVLESLALFDARRQQSSAAKTWSVVEKLEEFRPEDKIGRAGYWKVVSDAPHLARRVMLAEQETGRNEPQGALQKGQHSTGLDGR